MKAEEKGGVLVKALTYVEPGRFALLDKPKPSLQDPGDAIVRVTLSSICTSDLHIKHGSVPRAVPGVTVGHEMVGVVEQVGSQVRSVRPGDRVTVNVETFCGQCFFCKRGYVNNCTDPNGGWALGCRIDGGQAEYVRVPYAGQGLNRIPASVTDEQALFVGDILATGFWAARISAIQPEDTVLILGAGPTGICTLLCAAEKPPAGHRLRKGPGQAGVCSGALPPGAALRAGGVRAVCEGTLSPRRRGRGAGGGRGKGHLCPGVEVRPPQWAGHRGGPL